MSIYDNYIECIKENLFLTKEEFNFKSDPRYNYVLEHVTPEQGWQYLNLIKNEYNNIYTGRWVKICEKNDQYGKPKKFNMGEYYCSPTNLRYLYQSLVILEHAKSLKIETIDIIEIGGGYGGLCLFLHYLSGVFKIKINSYIIYDLEEAQMLQKRYLNIHNIETSKKPKENSFLISNYAFSELPKQIRDHYENKVINPFCSHGFLAWNACQVYNFAHGKQLRVDPEKPNTHSNNKYVYF